MSNGVDFSPGRSIESRTRRLAEEIAETVYVRLETGAGVTRIVARLIRISMNLFRRSCVSIIERPLAAQVAL